MGERLGNTATSGAPVQQGGPLMWARALADLLTLSRLIGGVAIALIPWEKTISSLGKLIKYNLLLWSTDAVDGRIARHSQTPASWIGERDVLVDSALTLGTGVALARSGYIPGKRLLAWLGAMLVLYAVRPVTTLVLTFMFPLQLSLPVLAFVHGCPEIRLYIAWVALIAFVSRKRLKYVIEVFINGLPDRLSEWVWSWLPDWLRLTPEERGSFEESSIVDTGSLQTEDSGLSL